MKMKKIILLFSMIAVFFSLTACSDGQGEVNFEYNDRSIISYTIGLVYQLQNADDAVRAYYKNTEDESAEVFKTGISNFDTTKEECGEFKGYRSKEDGSSIMVDFADSENITEDEYNQFLDLVDSIVEENGENVTVTLKAVYEEREAEISFVYEENLAYAYTENAVPYRPSEITVTPEYTMGEKMAKAGANTLMGMGTVFIVLIFISIIIAQFDKIDKISTMIGTKWRNRKHKEDETTEAALPAAAAPASSPAQNPMDDAQLVAVITAAVAASNAASGGSDKLVVRSIKKAKR